MGVEMCIWFTRAISPSNKVLSINEFRVRPKPLPRPSEGLRGIWTPHAFGMKTRGSVNATANYVCMYVQQIRHGLQRGRKIISEEKEATAGRIMVST